MRRFAAHLTVVALVLLTCIEWPGAPVLASQPASHTTPSSRLVAATAPRGGLSTRQPAPIPWGSPLPAPLPTPIPWGSPLAASTAPAVPAPPWPVAGTITTPFSAAHPAVDIAAPAGKPVVAPFAGVVTWTGWRNNGGGLVVEIDHGGLTSLNHLSAIYVVVGQHIVVGQAVAAVGMTGNATGNHLHWAEWDGYWRNPLAP